MNSFISMGREPILLQTALWNLVGCRVTLRLKEMILFGSEIDYLTVVDDNAESSGSVGVDQIFFDQVLPSFSLILLHHRANLSSFHLDIIWISFRVQWNIL